jgi:hypothetical protein
MAKKPGTAVATWDEELSNRAKIADAQARTLQTGNKFFSLKSGVFSFDGKPLPGNEIYVVILDGVFANTHYAGKFDPGNPASPDCYAFGRDAQSMTPHDNVAPEEKHSDRCATCPMNVFGSADEGQGKACKNTYRLALIPAGNVDAKGKFKQFTSEEELLTQEVGYLMIPVTSVNKQFLVYVKQLKDGVWTAGKSRPTEGVVTRIKLVPDANNQFVLNFSFAGFLGDVIQSAAIRRSDEAKETIAFPYPKNEPKIASKAKAPVKGKKPSAASKARKY